MLRSSHSDAWQSPYPAIVERPGSRSSTAFNDQLPGVTTVRDEYGELKQRQTSNSPFSVPYITAGFDEETVLLVRYDVVPIQPFYRQL